MDRAGSQGADRIGDTVAVARTSPLQGRVLINIGRAGILPEGDTLNIARADTGALREAIAKHRDVIVGVKARLSEGVARENNDEVLRRAQEVASVGNVLVDYSVTTTGRRNAQEQMAATSARLSDITPFKNIRDS